MRKSIVVLTLFGLIAACSPFSKLEYNIPEATKTSPDYPEIMARLDKGKRLYKAYCTECHGLLDKGKDGVPNFSLVQIHAYGKSFLAKDPKNHAMAAKLSEEQMANIMLFLLVLKRPEPLKDKSETKN